LPLLDLINSAVGSSADKEKRMALEQLHSIIAIKKKNVWTKVYENLMKRHIELCVDLKDNTTAKDGLHQYRNLCILVDPNSLETIIMYLLDLAEARATGARQKADKVTVAAANRVADLDQAESPESIMLSSMTVEGAKERTDREVVIPWLRFLWESYRAVLELLYRLPKLERVYHKACERAFKFCMDYSRKMEFRRLCDMLRQQFANLQKQQPSSSVAGTARTAKPTTDLTPESIEYHLQTRFAQLEVATSFELWNEAFRTIEDINSIIALSKKTPKAKLMITYYEKLTRIFAVADNKLFHAYSWLKFYQWSLDGRKDIKNEEKSLMASCVVLAALSVPSISEVNYSLASMNEEDEYNPLAADKSSQLATLLDFQANPSRQLLLSQVVNLGLLDEILPELKGLYESLESKFFPLKLITTIAPALTTIRNQSLLKSYGNQIEKIAMIRVLQQLSKVYNTIKFEFLYKLFKPLQSFSTVNVEKMLVEAMTNKQLSLRISHANQTLTFKTASSTTQVMDTQVSKLGQELNKVMKTIENTVAFQAATESHIEQQRSLARRVYFTQIIAPQVENDFTTFNDRKVLIERRKEELERIQQEKAKEEKRLRDLIEHRRVQEAKEREEEEIRRREVEKLRKVQEKKEIARIQIELEKYNVKKTESELEDLDWDARVQLVVDAQNEALKQREEENRKLQEQVKRLDYSIRASRLECGSIVRQREAEQSKEDEELLATLQSSILSTFTEKHENDLLEKKRLERMQVARRTFEGTLLQKQRDDYDRAMNTHKKKLLAEKRDQRVTQARRLAYEERTRQEEEELKEQERIERERIERENYERLRRQREEEEERRRQKEEEEERAKKAAEERKASEGKRVEEEAARLKSRVDPFGRSGASSEAAPAAARARADPFGGAARTRDEAAPAPAPRRDPFGDNSRGGGDREPSKPSSGPPPAAATGPKDPFAGGGSRYVPPSARSAMKDEQPRGGDRDREREREPMATNSRAGAFGAGGGGFSDRRAPGGPVGAGGGGDRDRERRGPFGGGDDKDRDRRGPPPPPAGGERKPDGRSEGNSSWR
jgi:translation initiation factor 3 subunit A